ncbi:MAG: protein arginine kinase [Candidatus Omnitrophica bacterium]|nr:protein arginine kinase [Candidatus Omnitrophota bacterium]
MEIKDFLKRKSEWVKGEGPRSDIVMSTRIRIARNVNGHPFYNWADKTKRKEVFEKMMAAMKGAVTFKDAQLIKMKDTTPIERTFLVERHLISNEHTHDVDSKGLVIANEETLSIMLNEEDHLRLQVIKSGFNLMEAWKIIDEIDTNLGTHLPYAYSSKFGYLTACPTNTGTGLRSSVMLHMPALELTNQMERVYEAISKLGLTIRGFYGEGSEASGNFFQISNQVSLGHSEMDILDNFGRVVDKIIEREKDTRDYLMENKKREVTDNIFRSFGTLKSARIITSSETIRLLSAVRLGVDLGLIKEVTVTALNEILLLMQPGHLQVLNNEGLGQSERDIRRADMIRDKLV